MKRRSATENSADPAAGSRPRSLSRLVTTTEIVGLVGLGAGVGLLYLVCTRPSSPPGNLGELDSGAVMTLIRVALSLGSGAALVFAHSVWHGREWARVGLAVLFVVASVVGLPLLVPTVLGLAGAVVLTSRAVREYCESAGRSGKGERAP